MVAKTSARIEKRIILRAPRSRVWRALTNSQEFGTWFGARISASFAPNATISAPITIPGFEHVQLELQIERIEPESYFSYRWHPHAIEPDVDYSSEPKTLVEFHLEDVAEGTALTVIESGFENIPLARRAEALKSNASGWAAQLENIARHVAT